MSESRGIVEQLEARLQERAERHIKYGDVWHCRPQKGQRSSCAQCGQGTDEERIEFFKNNEREWLVGRLFELLDRGVLEDT